MEIQPTATGLVYVFTGQGKGKTSAAIGTAIRALARGWQVAWISWYKRPEWDIGEHHLLEMLTDKYSRQLQMNLLGSGFYIKKPTQVVQQKKQSIKLANLVSGVAVDDSEFKQHKKAAKSALAKVEFYLHKNLEAVEVVEVVESVSENANQPLTQLIVMDEVCNAITDKLVTEKEVLAVVGRRGPAHLVLTGRAATPKLIAAADLVTQMKKIKHPYDQGQLAVKGLDY